jgi:hypothetical protein
MKIQCNAEEASEAMRHRYERHEALACHLGQGIERGIAAHNAHEGGHGFPPAAPDEIIMSLVESRNQAL